MKKIRVIPVVLFKSGRVVQSKNFKIHRPVGTPTVIIDRLSAWNCDEVICLDISRDDKIFENRSDLNCENQKNFLDVLNSVSKHCFMPLTAGGKIDNIETAKKFIENGADKISINSIVHEDFDIVEKFAKNFGSQCIVVSIDVKFHDDEWKIFYKNGKVMSNKNYKKFVQELENSGAGEILINSIDFDGEAKGYNVELFNEIKNLVKIPIISLGGVGNWDHFLEIIKLDLVDAVAAANIFHFTENSYYNALDYLKKNNINVRKNLLSNLSVYKI